MLDGCGAVPRWETPVFAPVVYESRAGIVCALATREFNGY
ncbi:hypothetical protein [Alloactinosynnema sp. L-07]|nr:hypothetical protein [Alloactinosynnema sp. L-07]